MDQAWAPDYPRTFVNFNFDNFGLDITLLKVIRFFLPWAYVGHFFYKNVVFSFVLRYFCLRAVLCTPVAYLRTSINRLFCCINIDFIFHEITMTAAILSADRRAFKYKKHHCIRKVSVDQFTLTSKCKFNKLL